ncbi:hypothetical protein G5B47_23070 [Paenibacillus sp. 7124]|uniref:Uncharacterized protein n=1 Tax=Paenibacillus apii TaxID=1850370 RepID=A0A6M1PNV3_9BACL|nr:hypothetical protein [Paenibacillus apii]NGM85289.1 hypothetical protein [Paenibacillus apii]NJJ41838.1 hypothetical protein [Paenibacillus apii]
MNDFWGFSWEGLVVFVLVMVPNLFYFWLPKSSGAGRAGSHHWMLDVIEHASQAIFVLLLVFWGSRHDSPMLSPYTLGMAVFLFVYYLLWILYFRGFRNLTVLLGMAVAPVAYFILAEIWLHKGPAIVPTVIFGVTHIIITYIDYRSVHKS